MPDRTTRSRSYFKTLLRRLRGSNGGITRDMRLCASELHKLSTLGPSQTDLPLLRMTALNLDVEEVCRTVPETYQVLRRVCAICDNRTD